MTTKNKGTEVTIAFTGTIDNDDIFMEVTPENPLTITIGSGELPPSVEEVVAGMSKGERKKIRVSPEEGYGHRTKDLLHEVPLSVFKERDKLKPGLIIYQSVEKDGQMHKVPATVIELKEELVVVDYNHPLAGHHLTYDLTVLEIKNSQ